MLKTDIFDRGIPWTRLILRTGSMPDDLNVRWSQRLSVVLAFLLVVAICWGEVTTMTSCALALGCLNLRFLRLPYDAVRAVVHIASGTAPFPVPFL